MTRFERISSFARYSVRAWTRGGRVYYQWLGVLFAVIAIGVFAYVEQLRRGFIVTNMSDQIAWGAYIANFTFLVGAAAAAVMLVIPSYLYDDHALKEVVVLGEQFAVSAMVMCLLFVVVDLGHVERSWHMIPLLGRFNWPTSMLSWDVLALCGYLALNGGITLYLVYKKFHGREKNRRYKLFVYLAIPWAISIHTATAFLYSGLAGRPHWNAAILAPRFLASAFASGPALMIVALTLIERYLDFPLKRAAVERLRQIAAVSMVINLFLLASEIFTILYADTEHAHPLHYMLTGRHGYGLFPFTWTAIVLNVFAAIVFATKKLYRRRRLFLYAAVASVIGTWLEKGITFVTSGFVPTPLGEVLDYRPSFHEVAISAGIWAIGALVFTLLVKATVPIELGLRAQEVES